MRLLALRLQDRKTKKPLQLLRQGFPIRIHFVHAIGINFSPFRRKIKMLAEVPAL